MISYQSSFNLSFELLKTLISYQNSINLSFELLETLILYQNFFNLSFELSITLISYQNSFNLSFELLITLMYYTLPDNIQLFQYVLFTDFLLWISKSLTFHHTLNPRSCSYVQEGHVAFKDIMDVSAVFFIQFSLHLKRHVK